jgi:hypothetical protein
LSKTLFALAPTLCAPANCGTGTTDGLGVEDGVGIGAPPRLYRFELARLDLNRFERFELERLDLDRFERFELERLDLEPPFTALRPLAAKLFALCCDES